MHVWRDSPRVKADYSRDNADFIAMAASLGFITTRISSDIFGAAWLITKAGMDWLNPNEDDE